MDILLRDLAYAVRGLRKNLGFATVATITIALGIGACTAIFSVVNAVLLRPLPYADASRLVIVRGELRARNVKDWTFSRRTSATCSSSPARRSMISPPRSVPDARRFPNRAASPSRSALPASPRTSSGCWARASSWAAITSTPDATPEAQAPPGQPPPPARLPQIAILSDGFIPAVRAAVAAVDPRAPLAEAQPMTAFVDKAMAPIRFVTTLIGIFAAVAVILAAVGLYGVLSTIVRQRTSEIGMRMVFGAPRASILNLVVGEGLRLGAAGIASGLIGAFAITRVMASLLVGVTPTDPITFAAIVVLFVLIAVTASWLPARRASWLDPMHAIREE